MPAEHGPPGHAEHCGDILVGPYETRGDVQAELNKMKA